MAKVGSSKSITGSGATPVGKAPPAQAFLSDALDKAINEQRQEIVNAMDAAIAAPDKTEPKRAKKPIPAIITLRGFTGIFERLNPLKIAADSRDIHEVVNGAAWSMAMNASVEASKAFKGGRIDSALKHFAKAERSIGAAKAHAGYKIIDSEVAKAKAHSSHNGTREMQRKVAQYWKGNIDSALSAPKAAGEMLGMTSFRWPDGTDVSFDTLAGYVRDAKKALKKKP